MSVSENLLKIKSLLKPNVELVAVTKTQPIENLMALYNTGQKMFAENKVQEIIWKKKALPPDIQWHLIGHLQSNKVKQILPLVHCIQSVDSEKLLHLIQKEAKIIDTKIEVLLQLKIAKEESKYGLSFTEAKKILENYENEPFSHVKITGLMAMGTFTDDTELLKVEFMTMQSYFNQLNKIYPLKKLSMGMSGDFVLAQSFGSTSVRIGSALFH